MKKVALLFLVFVISSCSIQHALAPEHYNYIQAKNELTTDYALISLVEHTTIERLKKNQITSDRAKNIDRVIRGINFRLGLAKKLLEAGNYKESQDISRTEHRRLETLVHSLHGDVE